MNSDVLEDERDALESDNAVDADGALDADDTACPSTDHEQHEAPSRNALRGRRTPLRRWSAPTLAAVFGVIVVLALGGLGIWMGSNMIQIRKAEALDNEFVQAAQQGALNLTTIDYANVDKDIQRLLDSTTGSFRDDFQQRTQPFIDVVKQAKSKSEGTIVAVGLESRDGDEAQVLVALSVKTSNAGAPEQDPRSWRMRINVTRDGNKLKVSDVRFVP